MTRLPEILKLRVAVAFLGEKDQHAWWKSAFLSPLGFRIMERLTPRTSRATCFESASQAAMRVHDAAIGKGGVVHLFRLPPEEEQTIHSLIAEWDASDFSKFCDSADAAENFMASVASADAQIKSGPVHIGRAEDWRSEAPLAKLAAVYLAAFRSQTPAFPYFS